MASDKEWIEVVKEINQYKDDIKKSAQKIVAELDNPKIDVNIDKEIVEILNALGKIGTISGNARQVNSYADSWNECISRVRRMNGNWGQQWFLKDMLNRVCMISFDVKKKGKKFLITIPKIDLNLLKVG